MGAKGDSQFPIRSFDKVKPNKDQLKTQENEALKSDIVDFDWINKQTSVTYMADSTTGLRNAQLEAKTGGL